MRPPPLLCSALLLAACMPMNGEASQVPSPPADPAPPPVGAPEGTCDAARVQNHLGHTLTPAMTEQIRTQAGARSVRVIGPDQAVTMDFRPDRLNIEHDGQMKVLAIRCG